MEVVYKQGAWKKHKLCHIKCRTTTELTKKILRFCQQCGSNNINFFKFHHQRSPARVSKAIEDEYVEAAFKVGNCTAKKLKELFALLKNQTLGGLSVRSCPKMNCQ